MSKNRGKFDKLSVNGYECPVFLPWGADEGVRFPVLYVLGSEEREMRSLVTALEKRQPGIPLSLIIIGLLPADWSRDYSPFPAPGLNPGEIFSGGAGAYLDIVINEIKPYADKNLASFPEPENTYLMGYSLAGLCAMYAAYTRPEFSRFACVSPSLWFDGWIDFIKNNSPLPSVERLYLSLGKKEPLTKNSRMAMVGKAFEEACYILSNTPKLKFYSELNAGNHFYDIDNRLAKAVSFLMRSDS